MGFCFEMDKRKSNDEKYRVAGKKLRAEVERWDELVARATRNRLERLERDLLHELDMEMIDARRDW